MPRPDRGWERGAHDYDHGVPEGRAETELREDIQQRLDRQHTEVSSEW